jgi:hypothetical protein
MSRRRLYQRAFGLTLVVLLLAACSGARAEPTATPTSIPPTATATPVPPTATATPVPPTATVTPVPPTATATATRPSATPTQVFTLAASLEEIAGTTWRKTVGTSYIRFYEDGTFHQARALDTLDKSPFAICRFWFEGTQMFYTELSVSGVPSCGDAIGVCEVRLLEDGRFEIVSIEDSCGPRRRDTATMYEAVR